MMVRWVALLGCAALFACSPGAAGNAPSTQASLHAESGLQVIPLTVTTARGRHSFRVEVARTSQEQARGLMFRTAMGPDEGMVFPIAPPRTASFWMRNTVIPLDIIYIGTDGRVLNIAANAVPYDETPLPSAGLVKGVLELNGGRATELGIGPGSLVEW